MCVSYSLPLPLVFIAGSHGVKLAEPPLASNEVVTPAWLRRWGPQARSADQVGRSACSRLQLPPTSFDGLSWASSCLNAGACLVLIEFGLVLGLHLVHLSLNRCSDNFCDFMSGQSVLVTCILAQKHNVQVYESMDGCGLLLEAMVFSLSNHPCLFFF